MTKRTITGWLSVTNPMEFLKGDMANAVSIFNHKTTVKDWYCLGEVTLTVDVDYNDMTQKILDGLQRLEKEVIAEHELKLHAIKEKRATFLALAAPIDNPAPESVEDVLPDDDDIPF